MKNIFRDQILRPYTANTIKTLNQLLADLRTIRKRGYSIDNEEIEIGLRCVGAPIRDYTGAMVGAISAGRTVGSFIRSKNSRRSEELVMTIAAEISKNLGYEKPTKAKAQ